MHRLYANITPFYIKDLNIHRFWYPQGSWKQSPWVYWRTAVYGIMLIMISAHYCDRDKTVRWFKKRCSVLFYLTLTLWTDQVNLDSFANGDLALSPVTQALSSLSGSPGTTCLATCRPFETFAPWCQQPLQVYVLFSLWSMWLQCALPGWS